MNKVKVKVCHVVELYKRRKDNEQVYQIKLQTPGLSDSIGVNDGKYYYYKVTNPKVKEGDEVTIDLDVYDTYVEEFTPKGEDKVIMLTYLKPKQV